MTELQRALQVRIGEAGGRNALAREAGCDPSMVHRIMLGLVTPSPSMCRKLGLPPGLGGYEKGCAPGSHPPPPDPGDAPAPAPALDGRLAGWRERWAAIRATKGPRRREESDPWREMIGQSKARERRIRAWAKGLEAGI